MDIKLYRAENMGSKRYGDWWTPNLEVTQKYHKGPLSSRIAKATTNLDDYVKAAQMALLRTSQREGQPTLSNPKGLPLQERMKELQNSANLVKEGKLSLKDFTNNFPEGKYSNNKGLKPKTSYYQTAKPALKQVAKVAGPLGLAYGAYDYLSGTPVGDATINPNIKMVEEPNAFEKWYKKIF